MVVNIQTVSYFIIKLLIFSLCCSCSSDRDVNVLLNYYVSNYPDYPTHVISSKESIINISYDDYLALKKEIGLLKSEKLPILDSRMLVLNLSYQGDEKLIYYMELKKEGFEPKNERIKHLFNELKRLGVEEPKDK